MSAHDLIAQSIAEHRQNEWYYQAFQRDNPVLAPLVLGYLDSGPRPSEGALGENHYARGLVLAEDARRSLIAPQVAAFDIPRWRVTLPASSTLMARWRLYETGNNSVVEGKPHLATPASSRATGPKSWEWWLCGSVLIPQGFPVNTRNFATINPHNSSYDVGNTGKGGIGWGFGSGVSAFHIFFDSVENRFELYHDPQPGENHWPLTGPVERGRRYDFVAQLRLGRTDVDPGGGPGRTRVWVDGALAADTGNINTLHRAKRPSDGKMFTQTLLYRPWDGVYVVPSLSAQVTMERTATRVGRTLEEALADEGFSLEQEWENGSTQNLAPLRSSDFRAPVA